MTWILMIILSAQPSFPHKIHFQNGIECVDCHTQASTSAQSTDILLPPDSLCLDCHETSHGYHQPKSLPVWIAQFSHQAHAQTECMTCHKSAASPVLPKMATCAECHDGQKVPNTCSQCHDLKEHRLLSYHPVGWKNLHGESARTDESSCLLCHDQDAAVRPQNPAPSCGSCHTQENLALKVHPQNYEFFHAYEFEARTMDCASCHQGFQSCRDCHERKHVYPSEHNRIGWVEPTEEGGLHAQQAKEDPEKCLACHSKEEGTCLTCHSGGH